MSKQTMRLQTGSATLSSGSCVFDMLKTRRDFASNVGIDFKTPEEFFLHEAPHPFVREFEPNEYINESPANANASTLHEIQRVIQP